MVVVSIHRIAAGAAIAALSALGVTGCASQIDALAPVSGDDVSAVRTATTDVLLAEGLEILVAPVCEKDEVAITCEAKLVDGTQVSTDAPLDGTVTMTVTAAGDVVYDGSVQDVLDRAARGE